MLLAPPQLPKGQIDSGHKDLILACEVRDQSETRSAAHPTPQIRGMECRNCMGMPDKGYSPVRAALTTTLWHPEGLKSGGFLDCLGDVSRLGEDGWL